VRRENFFFFFELLCITLQERADDVQYSTVHAPCRTTPLFYDPSCINQFIVIIIIIIIIIIKSEPGAMNIVYTPGASTNKNQ
jgi:hypothetical protein